MCDLCAVQKPSGWIAFQARGILAIVSMLGNIFMYGYRINMSVAVVCMVREIPINTTGNTTMVPDIDGCGQLERAARGRQVSLRYRGRYV